MMQSIPKPALVALCAMLLMSDIVLARPMVRRIKSTQEFDRLLEKHTTQTGLPVIVDFYSDGCGPCRQIAPVFAQMAKDTGQENAVFVKVDTNAQHELSNRYNVRSLPTFHIFYNGKKVDSMVGAGESQLASMVRAVVSRSRRENVVLTREALMEYYGSVDGEKDAGMVDTVYNKCADMNASKKSNPDRLCVGGAALQLVKRLKDKYKVKPETKTRFTPADRRGASAADAENKSSSSSSSSSSSKPSSSQSNTNTNTNNDKPNLHKATKEELLAELEKRIEAEEEAKEEEEEEDEEMDEFKNSWVSNGFPERVTIIGGGPAGMSAAIYAARAGLKPVVIAPPMGGQLQGKGVDVENYPGLHDVTGPAVVAAMRDQAIQFGAVFEADTVLKIDASQRPLKVHTNSTTVETHTIVVATGAESNWLNVPGEYDMRGGGVSSCATCDGHMYRGKDVVVVGGGDTAMEEALVLARTSKSVTVVHRRDVFRASNILAQRVKEHPTIRILWNTVVEKIVGDVLIPDGSTDDDDESEDVDLDNDQKYVTGALVKNVLTGDQSTISATAVFVAIGHTPTTSFLGDIVEFDEDHPGYVKTPFERSTQTTVPGIFAAGDVSDPVYRQAVTSAGSGAAAALDAERWLSEEGLGNEEAEFEAELLAEMMAEDDIGSSASYNSYEEMGGRATGMKESARAEL